MTTTTVSGTLPDPALSGPTKTGFWARKRTMTTRALAGICLAAAIVGGIAEKSGADQQIADLNAQITAMQEADTTGQNTPPVTGLVAKHTTTKTKHPKATTGTSRYKCTKVG